MTKNLKLNKPNKLRIKEGNYYLICDDNYGIAININDDVYGVSTYKNTCYSSSMSGKQGDDLICFNLGYGFGDTSNTIKIKKSTLKLKKCLDLLKNLILVHRL